MGGGGGGPLFEAGRLLTFSAFRMGAFSKWALIRGSAFIRINTVCTLNGSLCAFYRFIEHTVKSVTNPYNLGSRSLGVSLGSLWAESVPYGFFMKMS